MVSGVFGTKFGIKTLVRNFACRVIDLFCNVPGVICCMFLKHLRKNILLQLNNIP